MSIFDFFNKNKSKAGSKSTKEDKNRPPIIGKGVADISIISTALQEAGARFSKYSPRNVVPELLIEKRELVQLLVNFLLRDFDNLTDSELSNVIGAKACQVSYEAGILAIAHYSCSPESMFILGVNQAILSFGSPSHFVKTARTIGFYNSTADKLQPVFKKIGDSILPYYNFGSQEYQDAILTLMTGFYELGLQAALPMLGDRYNP